MRFSRWRRHGPTVAHTGKAANAWQASAAEHLPERETDRAAVTSCLSELRHWEDFFAYPGGALLQKLDDRIASGDAMGTARLIHQISAAISSHSYRDNVGDWEAGDDSPNVVARGRKGPRAGRRRPQTLFRSADCDAGWACRASAVSPGTPQTAAPPGSSSFTNR